MKQKNTAVDLTDLAIGILILGITVGVGARILSLFASSQRTNLDVVTTINESTTLNYTAGADILTDSWVAGISNCHGNVTGTSEICAANCSIPAANYTLSIDAVSGLGTITNATATAYNDTQCTYTWYNTSSRADYSLATDATTGIAEFGNWFDILVIVGIAGVILALIFMAFGNRGQDAGVSY